MTEGVTERSKYHIFDPNQTLPRCGGPAAREAVMGRQGRGGRGEAWRVARVAQFSGRAQDGPGVGLQKEPDEAREARRARGGASARGALATLGLDPTEGRSRANARP